MNSQPMNIAEVDMNTYYIIMIVKQVQIPSLMQKNNNNNNDKKTMSTVIRCYKSWYNTLLSTTSDTCKANVWNEYFKQCFTSPLEPLPTTSLLPDTECQMGFCTYFQMCCSLCCTFHHQTVSLPSTFSSGHFPKAWKLAHIAFVPKSNNHTSPIITGQFPFCMWWFRPYRVACAWIHTLPPPN